MWTTPTGWADALSGLIGMESAAAVWLGDEVTVDALDISSGTVTSELTGGQIQTTLSLSVPDESGELFTGWAGSPLGVLGHRVRLASIVTAGGWRVSVPVGTMRVNSVAPASGKPWRLYAKSGVWVRGGQVLSVSCGDLLDQIADERFLAPLSPPSGATIASEVRRLCSGIVAIGDSIMALTGSVPSSITYDEADRLGTVVDLCRAAGVVPWMDRAGLLQGIDATGSGSVWTVPMDALVTFTPSADRSELRNGWVVTSESESREPLRGQSFEESGSLVWGGPFGRVPEFAHSPILTSNSRCAAAARTNRDADTASRRVTISIECGTDPAVDVLDTAAIELPGGTVEGLVLRVSRPLLGRSMSVDVSVDWEALRG